MHHKVVSFVKRACIFVAGAAIGIWAYWFAYARTLECALAATTVTDSLSRAIKKDQKFDDIRPLLLSELPGSQIVERSFVSTRALRLFELRAQPMPVGLWHGGPVTLTFLIATNPDGTIHHFEDITPANANW